MYLTVKQQIKHLSKDKYKSIKELCHTAKNLANEAIDLGINNLITAVSNAGKSFIIDGRKLKSINQWYNKQNAKLQSIKDKQNFGKNTTNRQKTIIKNRNNKVNDYISKAASKIIDYCINNDIGVSN